MADAVLFALMIASACRVPRLATGVPPEPLPGWQRIASTAGGFSVAMPATPTAQTERVETAYGVVVVDALSATVGDMFYAVAWSDYPPETRRARPGRLLDEVRDRARRRGNGRVVAERSFTFAGYPGRDVEIESHPVPDVTMLSRARLILVGTRLYQVIAAGPVREGASAFLDSFRLAAPPERSSP
jgi:hypothetical protein